LSGTGDGPDAADSPRQHRINYGLLFVLVCTLFSVCIASVVGVRKHREGRAERETSSAAQRGVATHLRAGLTHIEAARELAEELDYPGVDAELRQAANELRSAEATAGAPEAEQMRSLLAELREVDGSVGAGDAGVLDRIDSLIRSITGALSGE
jgi:hypothetical protein